MKRASTKRSKRPPVLLGLAAGLWGLSAGASAQVKPPTQAPTPRYLVRYLCFTIMPEPGALFPEAPRALPPILNKLNSEYGWGVTLTSDPQQFLARLRREEPRYTYQLDLAGQSALTPNVPCRLLGGPRPDDPQACRVDFTLSLVSPDTEAAKQARADTLYLMKIDPAKVDPALRAPSVTLIYTHMKGSYRLLPQGGNGMAESGGDDTMSPKGKEQILGRTRSMGLDGNATHKQTVFVFCILPN